MIELLSDRDRQSLGLLNRVESENFLRVKSERELQDLIAQYLNLRQIPFNRSRMDKRKTDAVGWPDFTFALKIPGSRWAVACAFEVKLPGSPVSDDQMDCCHKLIQAGWFVRIVSSIPDVQESFNELGYQ